MKLKLFSIKEKKSPGQIISCEGEELIVACADAAIAIKTLQIPNKKAMSFKVLQNGHADFFKEDEAFQ